MKAAISFIFCAALLAPLVRAQDESQDVSIGEPILDIIARNKNIERPAPPDVFPYRYVAEFLFDQTEGKKSESFQATYKVNPNAPAGQRVVIMTASSDTHHASFTDVLEALESEDYTAQKGANALWCNASNDEDEDEKDIQDLLGEITPVVVSETDKQAVLEIPFEKISEQMDISFGDDEDEDGGDDVDDDEKEQINKTARKFLKRMKSEVTLDKPDGQFRHMRIWLPKPMRIMLIAKIKKMEFNMRCAPAPNGFLYQSEESLEMAMSALGKKIYGRKHTKILSLE